MHGVICDRCGANVIGIFNFSKFSHIASCVDVNGHGKKIPSWEPVFTNHRELCYPCYVLSVRFYVAKGRVELAKKK